MWERCAELVEKNGNRVVLDAPVTAVHHENGRAVAVDYLVNGETVSAPATEVISSMPLPHLLKAMRPEIPDDVRAAADDIHFRDHLTVALVVPEDAAFPDNWIYVARRVGSSRPDPELRVMVAVHGQGRAHVPRPRVTSCSRATSCGRWRTRPRRARQA